MQKDDPKLDEYHYPDEEYVVKPKEAVDKMAQESSAFKKFIQNNKRKLLAVVIIFVAVLFFQWFKYGKNNEMASSFPEKIATPSSTLPSIKEENSNATKAF